MRTPVVLAVLAILCCGAKVLASPCYPLYNISVALQGVGSPLAADATAAEFISSGYNHNIDQRLLIAIAGAETQFATDGSCCLARRNAWNWNGGCGGCSNFTSYAHGVMVVTDGLRRLYFNTGLDTIPEIASIYTQTQRQIWINNVTTFYTRIGGDTGNLRYYASCCGDCNSSLDITIDELVTGVRQILGTTSFAECPVMDSDLSGVVFVNDILRAVNTYFGISSYAACVAP